MDTATVIKAIMTLFSEAYEGPADASATWFIDNEPNSGIFGLIAKVSAVEASWSTENNDPGTTIAAHVEHLRWSLANANRAMEGSQYQGNWKESWNTLQADETKWEQLRNELRAEFERVLMNLKKQTELPGDYLTGVMALIPHAAYHLGTIRQQIERVRMAETRHT